MAAPPAKPSPSNQAVQETGTSEKAATAGVAAAAVASTEAEPAEKTIHLKAPPTTTTLPVAAATVAPSYTSSENSENYRLAKELLNAGNFEEALSVIEQELETTKALLLSTAGDMPQELIDVDLHPSIAPLHYLYGTTLLYSLEEARDDGQDAAAMTVNVPNAGGENGEEEDAKPAASTEAAPAAAAAAADNPWAHLPPSASESAPAEMPPALQQAEIAGEDAEDIQIAWENFEVARAIVEKMLTTFNTPEMEKKLKLDLAQILLREGDLQRMNGRYTSAIQDYSSCLELRQAYLDKWNRKIADTQFNLGLTYLSSSSDLQKETTAAECTDGNPAAVAASNPASTPNAAALAKEHCEKGIALHVECAKTFFGILAQLCGVKPEELLQIATTMAADDEAKPAAAGFKTTGLDDDMSSSATTEASQNLNRFRKAVTSLVASNPPKDTVASDSVYDIQQLLDEIQETVDEAEQSLDAVRQAAQIKIQAQQQAAALSGPADGTGVSTSEDGATTSIGFGPASSTTAAAAAASATPATQPMMVVKKKKKRSAEEEDSKPPSASTDSKRAKTED